MSDIPTPGAESAAHTASPGILLSNERVKRGLSLQEVADRLKLSRKQLEAIENDEYDKLPGPAFARGFVRNYAKLLGLDATLLNASLDAHLPMPAVNAPAAASAGAEPAAAAARAEPAKSAVNPGWLKGVLALLALLLAAGIGYRLLTQGAAAPATPPLATPAVDSPMPQAGLTPSTVASPAPVSPATPSEVKPEAVQTETARPEAVKPADLPQQAVKPAAVDAGAAQAAVSDTGTGEVLLRARQAAWVSLTDAKGKKLVYGQITGEKRVGGGTPPYKLIIGNAQQVELNYKGQAVPLADKTKGSTARLELP